MSEWISVKDRLPENNNPILVYMPEEKGWLRYGISIGIIDDGTDDKDEVTHWMPLPLPPNENEYLKQLQEDKL